MIARWEDDYAKNKGKSSPFSGHRRSLVADPAYNSVLRCVRTRQAIPTTSGGPTHRLTNTVSGPNCATNTGWPPCAGKSPNQRRAGTFGVGVSPAKMKWRLTARCRPMSSTSQTSARNWLKIKKHLGRPAADAAHGDQLGNQGFVVQRLKARRVDAPFGKMQPGRGRIPAAPTAPPRAASSAWPAAPQATTATAAGEPPHCIGGAGGNLLTDNRPHQVTNGSPRELSCARDNGPSVAPSPDRPPARRRRRQ